MRTSVEKERAVSLLEQEGQDRDRLAQLRLAESPEARESLRLSLLGKNLVPTGVSCYKFWLTRRGVAPDPELMEFNGVQIQVLDVLFGQNESKKTTFALLFEAIPEGDYQQLPRLVRDDDIDALRDPFPAGYQGEVVDQVIAVARDLYPHLLSY